MFVIYGNRYYFFNSGPCKCELLYLTTPHESLSFVAGKKLMKFLGEICQNVFRLFVCCQYISSCASTPPFAQQNSTDNK